MNRDLKTVASFARDHGPASVADAARRLLSPRPAPRKAGPSRKAEKRESKIERNARMAEIRDAVFARHAIWPDSVLAPCTACQDSWSKEYGECHHVLSGPDRQAKERVDTCVWLCRRCHKLAGHDKNDLLTLVAIASYCVDNNMGEAARALARRIGKVEDTQRMLGGRGA